jgi:hypothetical protein
VFADGLPTRSSPHPKDSGAIVTSLVPDQQTDTTWFVAVTWASKHGDPNRNDGNPLDDPVKYRWGSANYEEDREKDLDNKYFKDTAGTPFQPRPKFPVSRRRLIITVNALTFVSTEMDVYANTVNKLAFMGYKAGEGKIDMPVADEQFQDNQSFWKVTFAVEFKIDGWNPHKILNEGPLFIDFAGGEPDPKPQLVIDKFGVPTGGVAPLTPAGQILDRQFDPFFQEFRMFAETDFDDLGINLIQAPAGEG